MLKQRQAFAFIFSCLFVMQKLTSVCDPEHATFLPPKTTQNFPLFPSK